MPLKIGERAEELRAPGRAHVVLADLISVAPRAIRRAASGRVMLEGLMVDLLPFSWIGLRIFRRNELLQKPAKARCAARRRVPERLDISRRKSTMRFLHPRDAARRRIEQTHPRRRASRHSPGHSVDPQNTIEPALIGESAQHVATCWRSLRTCGISRAAACGLDISTVIRSADICLNNRYEKSKQEHHDDSRSRPSSTSTPKQISYLVADPQRSGGDRRSGARLRSREREGRDQVGRRPTAEAKALGR